MIELVSYHLPFFDTCQLSALSKRHLDLLKSNEYWQGRASFYDVLGSYLSSGKISDPKIRYAWAIASNETKVLSDPQAVIYLQKNENILFPGLEQVIGFIQFMIRAVDHENKTLLDHGIEVFYQAALICAEIDGIKQIKHPQTKQNILQSRFGKEITQIAKYAVETNKKDIAKYLSEMTDDMDEFYARYDPDSCGNGDVIVKYGQDLDIEQEDFDYLGDYFTCLLLSAKVKDYKLEVDLLDMIKSNPEIYEEAPRLSDLIQNLGRYGSKDLLDYSLSTFIEAEDRVIALVCAVEEDRVDIVKFMFDRHQFPDDIIYMEIKSKEMFDLLMRRVEHTSDERVYAQNIYNATLRGGNYELIFKIIDKVEPSQVSFGFGSVPSLVKRLLVNKITDRKTFLSGFPYDMIPIIDRVLLRDLGLIRLS